jgi:hypothetical protein
MSQCRYRHAAQHLHGAKRAGKPPLELADTPPPAEPMAEPQCASGVRVGAACQPTTGGPPDPPADNRSASRRHLGGLGDLWRQHLRSGKGESLSRSGGQQQQPSDGGECAAPCAAGGGPRNVFVDLGVNWGNTLRLYRDLQWGGGGRPHGGVAWEVFGFEASPLICPFANDFAAWLNGVGAQPETCLPSIA